MSHIALLGGSFNPPHVAHQMICLWALSTGRAEQVWMVPVLRHALDKPLAPFEHRLRMCELAVTDLGAARVRVCDIEAGLGDPSRTLLTVRALLRRHPEHRFSLLVGADLLAQTRQWYRFDELEQLIDIIVVGRPGVAGPPDAAPMPAVSSTEVRQRLSQGRDVSHLVPAGVLAYLRQQGLYGTSGGSAW